MAPRKSPLELKGSGGVHALSFLAGGNRVVGVGRSSDVIDKVFLWDASTGSLLLSRTVQTGYLTCVTASVDGELIAMGNTSGEIFLLLTRGLEGIQSYRLPRLDFDPEAQLVPKEDVTSIALSGDGRVAVASWNRPAYVWNTDKRLPPLAPISLAGHVTLQESLWEDAILNLCFSPDWKVLVGHSRFGGTCIWDAETGAVRRRLEGRGDNVAIGAGATAFPLQAMSLGVETVISDAVTAVPFAWFPVPLDNLRTVPTGHTWVGMTWHSPDVEYTSVLRLMPGAEGITQHSG
jgi:WD40 repeat protein